MSPRLNSQSAECPLRRFFCAAGSFLLWVAGPSADIGWPGLESAAADETPAKPFLTSPSPAPSTHKFGQVDPRSRA
jgi:hypothetical protein